MTHATRHKWDYESERRIAACDTDSGCEQTERSCTCCHLIKITVHTPDGGIPYRAWRCANNPAQFVCEHTPPCRPHGEPVEVKSS